MDDIKTNLFIVQSVIEDMASDLYNIILADSANKGLSILLKQKVDLVLMDIMMPDIDGLEATQMIKTNKKTKDIPVIFVTAKNDDETISKCYKVGGDDYVSKPFNHVELLARISFHLASKEKDRLLIEEKEYAQNVVDLQENLILVTNDANTITTANKALLSFYGLSNLADLQKNYNCICESFIDEDDYFHLSKIDNQDKWIDEIISLSQDEDVLVKVSQNNNEFIFNVKATKFNNQYLLSFTDITYISEQSLEYKHEASYDALTKIYNRNMFHRLMDKKISLASQQSSSFVFIIFDIDYFKKINDTYGHLVGDDILINLTKLIKKHIRDNDVFARWGGEEFVLAFDVGLSKGVEIAENLRAFIQDYKFDRAGTITCSFGVTEYKANDKLDAIIKRADDALYKAKDTGRNKVCEEI
ncbi:MAG: diguanylate cyclase [Sulfurimonas sp.]|nr:diguanylate cyclase [Sulfurimonas sp.]